MLLVRLRHGHRMLRDSFTVVYPGPHVYVARERPMQRNTQQCLGLSGAQHRFSGTLQAIAHHRHWKRRRIQQQLHRHVSPWG